MSLKPIASIFYLTLCGVALTTQAQTVDFENDVWPIFQANCIECHGADNHEGNLRLDARAIAFKGGVNGSGIIAGKPQQSLIYQRLIVQDEGERMPLESEALPADKIDTIRRWISAGAQWPDGIGVNTQQVERHWAYVVPERPKLPQVKNRDWPQNPIDLFVLQKLETQGLVPSAPVERRRLIRRVFLDLIGYPPTYEQVQQFVTNNHPEAYEQMVEELLASPQYGVRWARPWLDLARYADSNGYQADQYRNVWPYRDWVINALNSDMPFDQFTIEQIAGDLLESPTMAQKIATGFHRLTTLNVEGGVDPEMSRLNQVIDRVNTTGSVWLGSTIECSQCHNHKYDPFSQKEYYQLLAYFNNTPLEVTGKSTAYNFFGPKIEVGRTKTQQRQWTVLQAVVAKQQVISNQVAMQAELEYPDWIALISTKVYSGPAWFALTPVSQKSIHSATLTVLADQSILASGKNPDHDTFEIEFTTDRKHLSEFKLEALLDDSLPGTGPGRHTAEHPNFVLQEFTLEAGGKKIELQNAIADFSQSNFDVTKAVDGDLTTAWAIAPDFFKSHWAEFQTVRDIELTAAQTIKATFVMNYGGGRVIGRLRLSARTGTRPTVTVPPEVIALAKTTDRNLKQEKQLHAFYLKQHPEYQATQKKLAAAQKQFDNFQSPTALVMTEMKEPRATYLLIRGEYKNNGKEVKLATPSVLHENLAGADPNRLGLARWLTSAENPLVSRVTVNRWWAEIFGRGIVATEEDFGSQGDVPSHPDLLDWLAVEFSDHGWSMKHIHRLIVQSATYQQDSKVRSDLEVVDPTNTMLARAPRVRLTAEAIRDTMLQISGLLAFEMGGAPIYPPQPDGFWRHVGRNEPKYETSNGTDRFRRGVYVIWRRSAPYPSFTTFDAPDRTSCVIKRSRTNTPLQALTLLNDPTYWEMTRAFATEIEACTASNLRGKINFAFINALARKPTQREVEILETLYESTVIRLRNRPSDIQELVGSNTDRVTAESAAWCYIANVLLNLDETITRN
jgi:hypothetical protein